jgi:hypothetical protein
MMDAPMAPQIVALTINVLRNILVHCSEAKQGMVDSLSVDISADQ